MHSGPYWRGVTGGNQFPPTVKFISRQEVFLQSVGGLNSLWDVITTSEGGPMLVYYAQYAENGAAGMQTTFCTVFKCE